MTHKTGTRKQWLDARLDLLKAEKELTRRSDELAKQRQALPWVRIDKEYRFDTDAGPAYERFRHAYVHLSSNSPEFERICFRRYFLLAQYLAANPGCSAFVLIDSDVLLFRFNV